MNSSAVNEKYKTQRCRHFDMQGRCDLGEKCHFAHGDLELRKMSDVSSLSFETNAIKCISTYKFQIIMLKSELLILFIADTSRKDHSGKQGDPSHLEGKLQSE